MHQYLEFIANHPILFSLFTGLLLCLTLLEVRRRMHGSKKLSPMLATKIINNSNLVIDIRPSGEFKQGHIIGAKNISLSQLKSEAQKIKQDKSMPTLVYCKNGMHSVEAARQLNVLGFKDVYILAGGISAWSAESMPLEK